MRLNGTVGAPLTCGIPDSVTPPSAPGTQEYDSLVTLPECPTWARRVPGLICTGPAAAAICDLDMRPAIRWSSGSGGGRVLENLRSFTKESQAVTPPLSPSLSFSTSHALSLFLRNTNPHTFGLNTDLSS